MLVGSLSIKRPIAIAQMRGIATQGVWYEAECIVTNVTVSVEAAGFIESSIDFVTTGAIKLFTGKPPSFLLQEDSAYILQEDGSSRLILASD